MTLLEAAAAVVGLLLGAGALTAAFVRLVALPYLKDHLITPLLERLDAMHERDAELAAKDAELEASYRMAAHMFEGHMTASELDRGRLWEAIDDLRKTLFEALRKANV